jgi:hypothetical protein
MSGLISIRAGDWAAAHQRQTFVTGKASPPSHRGQSPPCFHAVFLTPEGRTICPLPSRVLRHIVLPFLSGSLPLWLASLMKADGQRSAQHRREEPISDTRAGCCECKCSSSCAVHSGR